MGTKLIVKPRKEYRNEHGRRVVEKEVSFNFYPWTDNIQEHTDARVRDLMTNPNLQPRERLGFNGYTTLLELPNFDICKQVPYDYMHGMCSGTTKRMFGLTYKISHSSIQSKRVIIRRIPLEPYNNAVIRQPQPSELNRRSRKMDFCNFKASEWRTVGLVNAIHIFEQCTDLTLKNCWIMYFWIMRAYATTTSEELASLNQYIDMSRFMKQFKLIYEKLFSLFNCSYNVHAIEHLPKVRESGTLQDFAAYNFENVFGVMINSICSGTRNITRQANLGTFCAYKGRRGKHLCQNCIRYQPYKEKCMHDDSLVYNEHGFWSVTKVNKIEKTCLCHSLQVTSADIPCKHGVQGVLNLSYIGVYKYLRIDKDVSRTFHFSEFTGKFMRVLDYVVKLPKDVLLECTWNLDAHCCIEWIKNEI